MSRARLIAETPNGAALLPPCGAPLALRILGCPLELRKAQLCKDELTTRCRSTQHRPFKTQREL